MVEGIEPNAICVRPPITSIIAGAAPLIGHVQDVDAGHQLEQLRAEMQERADARRAVLQLARLLLRQRR